MGEKNFPNLIHIGSAGAYSREGRDFSIGFLFGGRLLRKFYISSESNHINLHARDTVRTLLRNIAS
jgi:hypothetical protein